MIILGIISLVFSIINIPFSVAGSLERNTRSQDIEFALQSDIDEIVDKYSIFFYAIAGISIFFTIIGLVGAFIFNWIMVMLFSLWSCIEIVAQITLMQLFYKEIADAVVDFYQTDDFNFQDDGDSFKRLLTILGAAQSAVYAILTLLWIYPSFFLANEIRKGIMTKETVKRETYSCCCK